MSSNEMSARARIDAYLVRLRSALGRIPPEEADDILREIRGHIVERAEAVRSTFLSCRIFPGHEYCISLRNASSSIRTQS